MEKELVDKLFNDFLWRMELVEPVDDNLKIKLQIAFQEGVVKAQEHFINKLKSAPLSA